MIAVNNESIVATIAARRRISLTSDREDSASGSVNQQHKRESESTNNKTQISAGNQSLVSRQPWDLDQFSSSVQPSAPAQNRLSLSCHSAMRERENIRSKAQPAVQRRRKVHAQKKAFRSDAGRERETSAGHGSLFSARLNPCARRQKIIKHGWRVNAEWARLLIGNQFTAHLQRSFVSTRAQWHAPQQKSESPRVKIFRFNFYLWKKIHAPVY
jgi:hypothetical protein